MKLHELQSEAARVKVRQEVAEIVSESIIELFGTTLAKLKNKHPEELFSEHNPDKLSLEQIAKMITALKVISNKEYRSVMTHEDVGINPNSAREVFQLLDSIKKTGQQDTHSVKVIDNLASLAPSIYRTEMKSLGDLKEDDDEKRKAAISKLEQFMLKASQMFQKLKTGVSGTAA